VADVEALRAATGPLGVPIAVHRYADADHGFHCDGRPAVYHRAAAGLAWQRRSAGSTGTRPRRSWLWRGE
jgi:carboxymethylenebutenolidase